MVFWYTDNIAYKPAKGTKNTSLHTWHLKVPLNSLIIFIHPLFFVWCKFFKDHPLGPKPSSFSLLARWLSSPEVAPHSGDDAQHSKVTSAAGRLRRLIRVGPGTKRDRYTGRGAPNILHQHRGLSYPSMVGGFFTNPFEKNMQKSNWIMKPQVVLNIINIWVATTQPLIFRHV